MYGHNNGYGSGSGYGNGNGNGYGNPGMGAHTQGTNYYSNSWGASNKTKSTANEVDHVADKIHFLADMIETQLRGFDAIEQELLNYASSPVPPSPEVLRTMANRIHMIQEQIHENTDRVESLARDIDRATDTIQNNHGW